MIAEIREALRRLIAEKGVYSITRKDLYIIAIDTGCKVADAQKQLDYFKYSPQTKKYRVKWQGRK